MRDIPHLSLSAGANNTRITHDDDDDDAMMMMIGMSSTSIIVIFVWNSINRLHNLRNLAHSLVLSMRGVEAFSGKRG